MIEWSIEELRKKVRNGIHAISVTIRTLARSSYRYSNQILPLSIFQETYSLEKNTVVYLYADDDALFPGFTLRINPATAIRQTRLQVSLVATALNEVENVAAWVETILHQTRLPDEIIITDTGSTDGTYAQLLEAASKSPIPFQVVQLQGGNIAQGRNFAIRHASHSVIAVTDFGTFAHPDWLERLIAPFEVAPDTEVAGGWYRAVRKDGQLVTRHIPLSLDLDDPNAILSPGASIAFQRQAWEKVGGFPEWLTMTGEDTYFNVELRRCTRKWAYVPQALVDWRAPDNELAYWKKIANWASGDGESGLHASYYGYAFFQLIWTIGLVVLAVLLQVVSMITHNLLFSIAGILAALAWIIVLLIEGWARGYSFTVSVWQHTDSIAQVLGYLSGLRRRLPVSRRRLRQVRGVYFIFAGVPIDDTGGGSRFAQFAQELIRQQFAVVYLYKFPKGESVKLNLKICHPNLFHCQVDQFDLKQFLHRFELTLQAETTAALVEVPLPEWLPVLRSLAEDNIPIIYDLLDDWETNLGGAWYDQAIEREIARLARIHIATTPLLANKLESICGKPVTLLPNAVNLRLFNPDRFYTRPAEALSDRQKLIYIGALYGSWFDWELLLTCARAYPAIEILVIGDYRGQSPETPANLHFLGLKRQNVLPAYLAATDVAIIPWKVNPITLATSPIKIYEYLAMRKPVVAPYLPDLQGIPGVYFSSNQAAFLQNIALALRTPVDKLPIQDFLDHNSWEYRVRQLQELVKEAQAHPA
jgi:cellulose synthase/poly-beta-1,6-N-acetylglucosamine synthase-like glycosyltransferase